MADSLSKAARKKSQARDIQRIDEYYPACCQKHPLDQGNLLSLPFAAAQPICCWKKRGPYKGQINDVFIRRALVDTGSSVNILPLSVLTAAGIPLSKIVQSQTNISGFRNKSEVTVGQLQVNLKVGPIRSLTKFYVVDVDVAYHSLLGRPWLNKHKLVVSTYQQCVKGRIGMRPLRIPGNQAPFNKDEAHYSEAEFYTECTGAGSNPSKDVGTYVPSWTEIRDLSNEELITIVD
ncbi:unnamed protein product [Prunus armeniaca]